MDNKNIEIKSNSYTVDINNTKYELSLNNRDTHTLLLNKQGAQGKTGNGIESMVLIDTTEQKSTYRITYTNGTYQDIDLYNGLPGKNYWGSILGNITNQTDLNNILNQKELLSNKITSLSRSSTNEQYPSGKAVYDITSSLDDRITTSEDNIIILGNKKADKSNTVTHPENTAVGSVHRPIYVDSNGQSTQCSYDLTIVKGLNKENSKLYLVGSDTQNYFADSNTNVNNYIDADNILNTLTASNDDNSTKVATTEFVKNIINFSTGVNKDLSNLTDTGKKVMDGQWVANVQELSKATASGTYTIDLSTYLPNDNYSYEVLFYANGYYSGGNDSTPRYTYIYTDTYDFSEIQMLRVRASTNANPCCTVIIPIGEDRKVYYKLSNKLSSSTFKILAYRRIGTNI